MSEAQFQRDFVKRLKTFIPGCMVLKNDSNYIQGIPDLLVLYKDRWVALEVKKNKLSTFRPNQTYYLNLMDEMSAAFVVHPDNQEEVIYEIQRSLKINR